MDKNGITSKVKNPYVFRLTLISPKGRKKTLERIVSSLTEWVDPSFQIINVEERLRDKQNSRSASLKQIGKLVTPAISVMLFMQETGRMCVTDAENILKRPPWTFHHKVELQNKNSPRFALGKQEFYSLAKDLPLWAACPVVTTNEHLRINVYVRHFKAMVEFYRAVTEVEIETDKPEFCVFQLYQQTGLDIQLSLKYSQYIYPIPADSAYCSFNVNSIESVKLGTHCDVTHICDNVYTTRDPDGNLVVLYEQSKPRNISPKSSTSLAVASTCKTSNDCTCSIPITSVSNIEILDDVKSMKSSSDSQDSGRCSDMEGPLIDNVFVIDGDVPNYSGINKDRVKTSEGYSSSEGSAKDAEKVTNNSNKTKNTIVSVDETTHSGCEKGKLPKRALSFPFFGKGKAKAKDNDESQIDEKKPGAQKDRLVPVYI